MKRCLFILAALMVLSQSVHAKPTQEQYNVRVRAETLLKAEVRGDGSKMTDQQADTFSNTIIKSLQQINDNQLSKGMTCSEIKEFVDVTIGKKLTESGMAGVMFQTGKYLEADCAIKMAWKS